MIRNNVGAKCVIERVMAHADVLNFKTMRVGIATYLHDDGIKVEIGSPHGQPDTRRVLAEYMAFKAIREEDTFMRERMCQNMSPLSHQCTGEAG